MKAILWKELRENAKWAAIGLLSFTISLVYAWNSTTNSRFDAYQILLSSSVFLVTAFAPAIVGIGLGLLQTMPEQSRDRWAFLIHRPISKGAIFWGKFTAGIILFSAVTLPPFTIFACWIAAPGNLPAPFDWRMALGGFSNILYGLIFYLAGLLSGLSKGSWLGSRPLPLLAAISVSMVATILPEFVHVLIWFAAAFAVGLCAARAVFVGNGNVQSQSWQGRTALFLVFFLGALQLTGWLVFFSSLWEQPAGFVRADYAVLKDGRPIKVYFKDATAQRVTSLGGEPIEISPEQLLRITDQELPKTSLDRSEVYSPSFRALDRYVNRIGHSRDGLWYFVHATGLYEQFDPISKKRIGYLTPQGFISAAETPSGFQGRMITSRQHYSPNLAVPIFGAAAYLVDFANKRVKVIYESEPRPISAQIIYPDQEHDLVNCYVGVALPDRIEIFSKSGDRLFDVHRDPSHIQDYDRIDISVLPDGSRFFFYFIPYWKSQTIAGGALPTLFSEYAADGKLLRSEEMHEEVKTTRPTTPHAQAAILGAAFPPALQALAIGITWLSALRSEQEYALYAATLKQDWPNFVAGLIATVTAAVVAALLALARMRGQAFPVGAKLFWVLTILLTGFAGLLAFLAVRPKTARVACTACKRPRLIDRESCEHCTSGWHSAPADGTEIYSTS